MRDCWKNRAGYDRVLMTVAATFLTVSASSALAQNDAPRNSAAELAIAAAVPRPEPANVPPPTSADFKLDTPSVDATKAAEQAAPEKAATKAEPAKEEANKAESAKVACRNIRRDGNKHFDTAEKDKEMTEDDRDAGKEQMQTLLKTYEEQIEQLEEKKTKEIMEQ